MPSRPHFELVRHLLFQTVILWRQRIIPIIHKVQGRSHVQRVVLLGRLEELVSKHVPGLIHYLLWGLDVWQFLFLGFCSVKLLNLHCFCHFWTLVSLNRLIWSDLRRESWEIFTNLRQIFSLVPLSLLGLIGSLRADLLHPLLTACLGISKSQLSLNWALLVKSSPFCLLNLNHRRLR